MQPVPVPLGGVTLTSGGRGGNYKCGGYRKSNIFNLIISDCVCVCFSSSHTLLLPVFIQPLLSMVETSVALISPDKKEKDSIK